MPSLKENHVIPRKSSGSLTSRDAIGHHGELVQGVFEDDLGRLHRGLVTLPLDGLRSTARIRLAPDSELKVRPQSKMKALRAAQLTLAELGVLRAGGMLEIFSKIPVGHGYGSSTADVVASIKVAAAALGIKLSPAAISRLAVSAEIASDATAFEAEAVLFAQREGEVLEHFGGPLPPFILIGFISDHSTQIDTLELAPARYDLEEIQLFRVLRGLVARAVKHQDPKLLGRAATLSATTSQRHLPKPHFEFLLKIAERHSALGVQVAHSGSLCGLMLEPSVPESHCQCIISDLKSAGFRNPCTFTINSTGGNHAF